MPDPSDATLQQLNDHNHYDTATATKAHIRQDLIVRTTSYAQHLYDSRAHRWLTCMTHFLQFSRLYAANNARPEQCNTAAA